MPAASDGSLVLHTIYEDSLDARWRMEAVHGANVTEDDMSDAGFCFHSLRLSWQRGSQVWFHSRTSLLGLDDPKISARVTFLVKPLSKSVNSSLIAKRCSPHLKKRQQPCVANLCITLILPSQTWPPMANVSKRTGRKKKITYDPSAFIAEDLLDKSGLQVPLCAAETSQEGQWLRVSMPLKYLYDSSSMPYGLAGLGLLNDLAESHQMLIDDLQIVSDNMPSRISTAFVNVTRPAFATISSSDRELNLTRSSGWCQYMSSDYVENQGGERAAQACLMNGDHLRGRWIQNCEPSLIGRPDVYAYGRPLPIATGKFDFRMCFRMSLWERIRAQLAMSWTWRPDNCHMERFDAQTFDALLGQRTLLMLGDSLTAQMYYSLVFLLGASVVSQLEHHDGLRASNALSGTMDANVTSSPLCSTSAAEEGLSAFSEVRLARGGRIIKVLGHNRYIQEMQRTASAPWARFAKEADFVLINVGHHYRYLDKTFENYNAMVRGVERGLQAVLKPSARIIIRTTNLGHRGCEYAFTPYQDPIAAWSSLSEPNKSPFEWTPPDPSELADPSRGNINAVASNRSDPFDWRAPSLHESEWLRVFGQSSVFRNRFSLLNVSFVDQRPDGHVAHAMWYAQESERRANWGGGLDCLHYCFPGPTDFWAQALHNQLLRFAGGKLKL